MDNKITTGDDITMEKEGLGSLSKYVAEQTIHLEQFKDKVHFKLDLLDTEEDQLSDKTLEIPERFKNSLFCQAIIAYLYDDVFLGLSDSTKSNYIDMLNRFFLYLTTHDEGIDNNESWARLITLQEGDLPHNVIQKFLLYLSENTGSGSNTLHAYQNKLLKVVTWATQHNITTSKPNFANGHELLPYVSDQNNPRIKRDDVTHKQALSQLFTINYETGEEIKCPYSDSQLITNLRWFAMWYLNTMRQKRLFLRKIMWDEERTIYEALKDKIEDGTWSIECAPLSLMYGKSTETPITNYLEASAMYAKVYEALLPSKVEAEKMSRGEISSNLENRLMWAESEGHSTMAFISLVRSLPEKECSSASTIKRLQEKILYNSTASTTKNKHESIKVPIRLHYYKGLRESQIPHFSLASMFIPTKSEHLVMTWLLASESIQWSNKYRLKLDDLMQFNRGKRLQATTNDIKVNSIEIAHHKGRSKDKAKRRTGKDFKTLKYKKGDPLFTTYTNWHKDMKQAQSYITKQKESWFYYKRKERLTGASLIHLSFLVAKDSLFKSAFKKSEKKLKFHSEVSGEGAFQWLFTQFIINQVNFLKVRHTRHLNNSNTPKEISLNSDAIRQSRIIFEEGEDISDKENAKRTAHSEGQVHAYRENGEAKERIQNGLKGNVQVANKMYEEAIRILESCHLMSVEEVEKQLHAPKGITTDDVIGLINQFAENPKKYDMTIFGGIKDKSHPESGIRVIKDEKSAWMMYCYIKHMESELDKIKENHDAQQVTKHIVEHAQWEILFERFPIEMQKQAKVLAEQYDIPYPPLF